MIPVKIADIFGDNNGRVPTIQLALRQLMLVAVFDAFNYQIFVMRNCNWVLEVDIICPLNNIFNVI
jgi:nicotinamide mononucleotide adenylyltransferase